MKESKANKLKAFTLAETLVTLGIVGVIAAMTIPTLKKNSEESKYVALTKRAFAEISTATQMVEAKYGDLTFWNRNDNSIPTRYKEFMHTVPDPKPETWSPRLLDGSPVDSGWAAGTLSTSSSQSFTTLDGMVWKITQSSGFVVLVVDVNGPEMPNIMGVDVQGFYLDNKTGVRALGDGYPSENGDWACTPYIMKYSKMPWITDTSITSCTQVYKK